MTRGQGELGTIVVLADRQDLLAARVVASLRNARQPVDVMTPLDVSLGSAWAYDNDGLEPKVRLRRHRAAGPPRAVLNRLHAARFFPDNAWSTAHDAVYAKTELSALVAGWLAGLRCLVLGPTSGALVYQRIGATEWLAAAREAWLPTRGVTRASAARDGASLTLSASTHAGPTLMEACVTNAAEEAEPVTALRRVYVVAGQVIDAPDESLIPGLQRLAEQSGCNLLECHFGWTARSPGRWVFCDATAVPMDAPAALLDAIVAVLAGRERLQQSRP